MCVRTIVCQHGYYSFFDMLYDCTYNDRQAYNERSCVHVRDIDITDRYAASGGRSAKFCRRLKFVKSRVLAAGVFSLGGDTPIVSAIKKLAGLK